MNNKKDVKDLNISSVLQCINKRGSISKGMIAKELGITSVTSHKLVSELCMSGYACESGEYVSYGGKRAALYRVNRNLGLMIGISLMRNRVCICVTDFCFNKKEYYEHSTELKNAEQTVESIIGELRRITQKYKNEKILGIGISIPGRACEAANRIYMPGYHEWDSVKLSDILKNEFSIPVFIDNDANALSLYIKWRRMTECNNFVCAQAINGIGIGIITNGELFKGSDFRGSEIGHIILDPKGEPCSCGKRGCLQTFVDEEKVLMRLKKQLGDDITLDKVLDLLNKDDENVKSAFVEYFEYLKITVDNIITLFAPEEVYLYNEAANAMPDFEESLQLPCFRTERDVQRPKVKLLKDKMIRQNSATAIIYNEIMKKPTDFINKRGN
ncbi:MAG: ROK family protein [Ruminococcaceae bacterium]|nr:ROK family protein [Oscillospiraceae bacterium]